MQIRAIGKDYRSPLVVFGKGINASFSNLNSIDLDTFYTPKSEFYFKANNKGYQNFRAKIIDGYFHSSEKKENGEIEMIYEENFYYVDKRVFVKE